jgi:hypothetical protein
VTPVGEGHHSRGAPHIAQQTTHRRHTRAGLVVPHAQRPVQRHCTRGWGRVSSRSGQ